MQGDGDITYSLISAVREGKLKRVEELISSFGLSYSQEWSDGYVLLCDALKNKRTEVAKLLITSDSKVNSKNANYSESPLYFAIRNGDVEIVEMLLDRGASTDVTNYGYSTPLHDAVRYGYINDAKRQLRHRASVDAQVENDVLRSTVTNRGIKIIKMLLDKGANIDAKCHLGNSPLFDAVMKGYANGVKLLLEYGANVNAQRGWRNETMLQTAVKGGHSVIIEHLIKHGASVNPVNTDFHQQPLYTAIEWKCEKVVKLLLECGANVNAQNTYGKTILHFAVEKGHSVIVDHILKHRPDVNNKSNKSALNVAMRHNRIRYGEIVKKLLEYGFIVDFEYENNCKLLHDAVEGGCFQIVEQLLKHGTDVNALYDSTSGEGSTPLHVVIKKEWVPEAKLLISYGADVNAKDIIGATPICYAVEHNCRKIVEVLLEHGADVNSRDKQGRTPLHFTALKEYDEFFGYSVMTHFDLSVQEAIAKLLLRRGANIHAQTENGITTLHFASRQGNVKLVEALLECNADVNCTDKIHRTPLHLASMNCNLEIVETLLKFGAVIDSTDEHGRTALHIASEKKHLQIVKILLKFGASIDSKDEHGRTALHIASEKRRLGIVRILLKFGASIDAKDDNGRTALHIASEEGDLECVKILLKLGVSIDSKDAHGRTALHIASEQRDLECVKILLKFGASIDSSDECGRTALHIASAKKDQEIVKSLLNFGASIDSKDERGRTALHIACGTKNEEVVVALLEHGSDITIMINCKLNSIQHSLTNDSDRYKCYYCRRSYRGYGFCNYCLGKNIAEILNRHMIKVKIANLYASNKELLSISSNDDLSDFENECEKEVASMKSEKVGNSDISFYDILTKGTSQLAIYAGNKSIVHVCSSDDYKIRFPIYATMINSNFRKGERRKVLMEQGNKIFQFLTNFLGINYDCIGNIFTYLSDDDLRSIMVACKPICVSSRNTDNKYRRNTDNKYRRNT